MADPDAEDRRKWPRMDVFLTVRLTARDFRELLENVSGDISLGGLFLRTATPRPVGTEVKLTMVLETERQTLRVLGEVVRSITAEQSGQIGSPAGMAIRFLKFGAGDDKALAWLLQLHGKK